MSDSVIQKILLGYDGSEDSEKAAFNEYRQQVARESKFGTFGDLFAKQRSNS